MPLNPIEVMESINDYSERLDTSSKEQYYAILAAATAEARYKLAFETEIVKIQVAADGDRLPAEDVRRALAHERIDRELYLTHVSARSKAAALQARARGIEAAMTGKQSVLKTLNEEARHS